LFLSFGSSATDRQNPMSDSRVLSEIDGIFADLEQLLKTSEAGDYLAQKGVNIAIAITLADGLRAYLRGEREKALEDVATASEEIAARLKVSKIIAGNKPS
jgi:hypothetical protein